MPLPPDNGRTSSEEYPRKGWIRQLYREHEQICFRYRLPLKPAVMDVRPSTSWLGLWEPASRRITLAEGCIRNLPWPQVLEVLKHEMAHQLVDEVDGAHERPHGESFRSACQRLGVAAWAAAPSLSWASALRAARGDPAAEPMPLRRARKLLSLTQSPNQHEAALALERVQELLHRHALTEAEVADEEYDSAVIHHHRQRFEAHEQRIAGLLTRYYRVEVIYTTTYCSKADREFKALEILGARRWREVAVHAYHFLRERLPVFWREHRRMGGHGGLKARNSFYDGVLTGVEQQLQRQETARPRPHPEEKRALALSEHRLDRFVKTRHPRTVTLRRGRRSGCGASFRAGERDGRELKIRPTIYPGGPLRIGRGKPS